MPRPGAELGREGPSTSRARGLVFLSFFVFVYGPKKNDWIRKPETALPYKECQDKKHFSEAFKVMGTPDEA